MNEPPRGLKATLLLGLRSLPTAQLSQGPTEKHRRSSASVLFPLLLHRSPTDTSFSSPQFTSLPASFTLSFRSDSPTNLSGGRRFVSSRFFVQSCSRLTRLDFPFPPGLRDQRLRALCIFPSYRHLPGTLHQSVQRRSNFASLEVAQGSAHGVDLRRKVGRKRREFPRLSSNPTPTDRPSSL